MYGRCVRRPLFYRMGKTSSDKRSARMRRDSEKYYAGGYRPESRTKTCERVLKERD